MEKRYNEDITSLTCWPMTANGYQKRMYGLPPCPLTTPTGTVLTATISPVTSTELMTESITTVTALQSISTVTALSVSSTSTKEEPIFTTTVPKPTPTVNVQDAQSVAYWWFIVIPVVFLAALGLFLLRKYSNRNRGVKDALELYSNGNLPPAGPTGQSDVETYDSLNPFQPMPVTNLKIFDSSIQTSAPMDDETSSAYSGEITNIRPGTTSSVRLGIEEAIAEQMDSVLHPSLYSSIDLPAFGPLEDDIVTQDSIESPSGSTSSNRDIRQTTPPLQNDNLTSPVLTVDDSFQTQPSEDPLKSLLASYDIENENSSRSLDSSEPKTFSAGETSKIESSVLNDGTTVVNLNSLPETSSTKIDNIAVGFVRTNVEPSKSLSAEMAEAITTIMSKKSTEPIVSSISRNFPVEIASSTPTSDEKNRSALETIEAPQLVEIPVHEVETTVPAEAAPEKYELVNFQPTEIAEPAWSTLETNSMLSEQQAKQDSLDPQLEQPETENFREIVEIEHQMVAPVEAAQPVTVPSSPAQDTDRSDKFGEKAAPTEESLSHEEVVQHDLLVESSLSEKTDRSKGAPIVNLESIEEVPIDNIDETMVPSLDREIQLEESELVSDKEIEVPSTVADEITSIPTLPAEIVQSSLPSEPVVFDSVIESTESHFNKEDSVQPEETTAIDEPVRPEVVFLVETGEKAAGRNESTEIALDDQTASIEQTEPVLERANTSLLPKEEVVDVDVSSSPDVEEVPVEQPVMIDKSADPVGMADTMVEAHSPESLSDSKPVASETEAARETIAPDAPLPPLVAEPVPEEIIQNTREVVEDPVANAYSSAAPDRAALGIVYEQPVNSEPIAPFESVVEEPLMSDQSTDPLAIADTIVIANSPESVSDSKPDEPIESGIEADSEIITPDAPLPPAEPVPEEIIQNTREDVEVSAASAAPERAVREIFDELPVNVKPIGSNLTERSTEEQEITSFNRADEIETALDAKASSKTSNAESKQRERVNEPEIVALTSMEKKATLPVESEQNQIVQSLQSQVRVLMESLNPQEVVQSFLPADTESAEVPAISEDPNIAKPEQMPESSIKLDEAVRNETMAPTKERVVMLEEFATLSAAEVPTSESIAGSTTEVVPTSISSNPAVLGLSDQALPVQESVPPGETAVSDKPIRTDVSILVEAENAKEQSEVSETAIETSTSLEQPEVVPEQDSSAKYPMEGETIFPVETSLLHTVEAAAVTKDENSEYLIDTDPFADSKVPKSINNSQLDEKMDMDVVKSEDAGADLESFEFEHKLVEVPESILPLPSLSAVDEQVKEDNMLLLKESTVELSSVVEPALEISTSESTQLPTVNEPENTDDSNESSEFRSVSIPTSVGMDATPDVPLLLVSLDREAGTPAVAPTETGYSEKSDVFKEAIAVSSDITKLGENEKFDVIVDSSLEREIKLDQNELVSETDISVVVTKNDKNLTEKAAIVTSPDPAVSNPALESEQSLTIQDSIQLEETTAIDEPVRPEVVFLVETGEKAAGRNESTEIALDDQTASIEQTEPVLERANTSLLPKEEVVDVDVSSSPDVEEVPVEQPVMIDKSADPVGMADPIVEVKLPELFSDSNQEEAGDVDGHVHIAHSNSAQSADFDNPPEKVEQVVDVELDTAKSTTDEFTRPLSATAEVFVDGSLPDKESAAPVTIAAQLEQPEVIKSGEYLTGSTPSQDPIVTESSVVPQYKEDADLAQEDAASDETVPMVDRVAEEDISEIPVIEAFESPQLTKPNELPSLIEKHDVTEEIPAELFSRNSSPPFGEMVVEQGGELLQLKPQTYILKSYSTKSTVSDSNVSTEILSGTDKKPSSDKNQSEDEEVHLQHVVFDPERVEHWLENECAEYPDEVVAPTHFDQPSSEGIHNELAPIPEDVKEPLASSSPIRSSEIEVANDEPGQMSVRSQSRDFETEQYGIDWEEESKAEVPKNPLDSKILRWLDTHEAISGNLEEDLEYLEKLPIDNERKASLDKSLCDTIQSGPNDALVPQVFFEGKKQGEIPNTSSNSGMEGPVKGVFYLANQEELKQGTLVSTGDDKVIRRRVQQFGPAAAEEDKRKTVLEDEGLLLGQKSFEDLPPVSEQESGFPDRVVEATNVTDENSEILATIPDLTTDAPFTQITPHDDSLIEDNAKESEISNKAEETSPNNLDSDNVAIVPVDNGSIEIIPSGMTSYAPSLTEGSVDPGQVESLQTRSDVVDTSAKVAVRLISAQDEGDQSEQKSEFLPRESPQVRTSNGFVNLAPAISAEQVNIETSPTKISPVDSIRSDLAEVNSRDRENTVITIDAETNPVQDANDFVVNIAEEQAPVEKRQSLDSLHSSRSSRSIIEFIGNVFVKKPNVIERPTSLLSTSSSEYVEVVDTPVIPNNYISIIDPERSESNIQVDPSVVGTDAHIKVSSITTSEVPVAVQQPEAILKNQIEISIPTDIEDIQVTDSIRLPKQEQFQFKNVSKEVYPTERVVVNPVKPEDLPAPNLVKLDTPNTVIEQDSVEDVGAASLASMYYSDRPMSTYSDYHSAISQFEDEELRRHSSDGIASSYYTANEGTRSFASTRDSLTGSEYYYSARDDSDATVSSHSLSRRRSRTPSRRNSLRVFGRPPPIGTPFHPTYLNYHRNSYVRTPYSRPSSSGSRRVSELSTRSTSSLQTSISIDSDESTETETEAENTGRLERLFASFFRRN